MTASDAVPAAALADLAGRLAALVEAVGGVRPLPDGAARRADRLATHLGAHVLPRARSLDAPLVVVLVGPTGSGKSSLLNAIAGADVSPAGVLRPTTRHAVLLARQAEAEALAGEGGPLAPFRDGLRTAVRPDAPAGLALVDAPDIDSVEHANRELADRLVEAADLAVFVTTATRYADRVPWDVLARVRARGLPLVVVVNRMPEEAPDRTAVLADIGRLLREHDLATLGLGGAGGPAGDAAPGPSIDVLGVPEGALDPARPQALDRATLAPLLARIDALAGDRDERRALAARALAGALGGLAPEADALADGLEHAAIDLDALARAARDAYGRQLATLREDLARGRFLRAEALAQWHAFVGADEITRLFATGIGKVRGTISALVFGTPRAPVAEVRDEALADVRTLARSHVAEAARQTAAHWSETPLGGPVVAEEPGLWAPTPDFDARLSPRLEAWVATIAEDIRSTGSGKRRLARGAAVGVNAAGIGVMLATFSHTGGLTGAEVGVAAATGFLNQKLLEALFGEAALVEMIDRARRRLLETLSEAFAEELARFERAVPDGARARDLAADLRSVAEEVRVLRGAPPPPTPART